MQTERPLFIIGDVHGCYYSLKKLLDSYWEADKEQLIQVGDLVSKGNNCPQVLALARKLEAEHSAVFLQGNHEYQLLKHCLHGIEDMYWAEAFIEPVIAQYDAIGGDFEADVHWLSKNPYFWEDERVLVSHAGISMLDDPFNPHSRYGFLWHKTPIKNIGKLQVVGHTPKTEPLYDAGANYCNVDTGAFLGRALTAVKIDEQGQVSCFCTVRSDERDWK